MALPSAWSTQIRSSASAWLSLAAILTVLGTGPTILSAQQVSGALGVSLTVLPPVSTQPVELSSFRVERNGIAQMETTAPVAGPVSVIVMSTVSSSANGFVPVARAPALVNARRRTEWLEATTRPTDSRVPGLRYEVDLSPRPFRTESHDVSVRITYLVVPGT